MTKKAVLVGIHYHSFHPHHRLGSAYQDVDDIKAFLIGERNPASLDDIADSLTDTLGFDEENITELKDNVGVHDSTYPSKRHLTHALHGLVRDAEAGDHLVFHFSGHGSQKPDLNGDEDDGMDEAIWPADVKPNHDLSDADGVIIDDWIKAELVDKVPEGATLTIFLDCCHSGTGADLKYSYVDGEPVPHAKHKVGMKKLTKDSNNDEAIVVSWAACQDPHLTISFSESGGYFVKAFIQAYGKSTLTCSLAHRLNIIAEEEPNATHQELLHRMKHDMLRTAQGHLEGRRDSMKRKHFQKLQNWWEDAHSEPVLGILNDEEQVLETPVAETFGVE
ncbi:caspase family protein [Phanerochaete sordida]|uniref:Caspase family protein n=1 Tax=Phanerochaete sordida TaxID=48140 RepID=A0A9P3FZQ1_9APHY|nr:caspase family protein [Phanerochaete sordida]